MKFTLKDYQEAAVAQVLDRFTKSRRRWHEDKEKNAFSLTAATGAGKTVMAAAVFEALFFGSDDYDFDADPGAVVIWFSDDPSLNEQSRFRLMEASDKLTVSDLVNVGSTFSRETFEPGKVYFLNTQKLSKNSLLVRGHNADDSSLETTDGQKIMPDMRSHTIWDTIQNTIADSDLTLYLVLDEAHRGMKESSRGSDSKPTIVKQLINGTDGVPGIPVVWGISATVERFDNAVAGMEDRTKLANVVVSSQLVQDSGLLKDTINLDVPDETGNFSTVLLRRGTEKLREISEAWEEYAKQQNDAGTVQPLMVLQVPNSPDHTEIGTWLETIFNTWPELPTDSVYNVFGEHKTEIFGAYTAHYIPPERVQESRFVRILVAKDAISTGWDCPRAEVMVSFRAASDKTHITQLLGRMVRTPLARRIPGNERLNSVDCLLPHFNKKSVEAVVTSLMTGDEAGEEMPGRRVLLNPREMKPNPTIPQNVWDKLTSLPSQTLPKKQARPVKRLTALAHELATDNLLADAGKIAHGKLHKVLEGARVTYADEIKAARESVLKVEGKTVKADVETRAMTFDDFVENADFVVIEDAYKRAGRALTPDVAKTYSEYLADEVLEDEDPENALIEAHTVVAALGLVPKIKEYLESEAEKLADEWLTDHRVAIKSLSDERQDVYREIREMSVDPLDVEIAEPKTRLQPMTARDADGTEFDLPRYKKHLLCDDDGLFPEHFASDWEGKVLLSELSRDDSVGWYRNPGRASQESLGVIYEVSLETKIMRPDFVFFAKLSSGEFVADIIDPHGFHLADALPKLKGLAAYAHEHGGHYRRIEAVAKTSGGYRVLDLTEVAVRNAVAEAVSAEALYESESALDYVA